LPFLEIECLPFDEEANDDCSLDFEAGISDDGTELLINNKFSSPPKISQGEEKDRLLLKFWGAPELRSDKGNKQLFAYA
jgi:hypothetical protein